jgi:hypothetical protein
MSYRWRDNTRRFVNPSAILRSHGARGDCQQVLGIS